ncbi:TPA: hypothetical protein DCZ32_01995 [Candidatus Uhrbacteria bacterium]|nr:hypothetical protein [Candidatus Uhrbacteria bacterium]
MEQTKSNTVSVVLAIIITAVIVGGGVYWWQNKENQPVPTQQGNQEQEARSLADCSELGSSWTQFSNSGTSLSFCYRTSWGTTELKETRISPEAKVGTIYYISFSDAPAQPLVNNNPYPLIGYSTLDFQSLGDSDVGPGMDWKALDFSKSETELALLFRNQNATVQKLTVNGKQVLKVHSDSIEPLSQKRVTPLNYFMPNVVINGTTYNLHINGSPEQEADLDKLLGSMVF